MLSKATITILLDKPHKAIKFLITFFKQSSGSTTVIDFEEKMFWPRSVKQ